MEIVREYSDHGRSGLNIAGRDGLNQLMSDVEDKWADFTSLLVYGALSKLAHLSRKAGTTCKVEYGTLTSSFRKFNKMCIVRLDTVRRSLPHFEYR